MDKVQKIREKVEKLKKLADAMYYAAQHLTTDASRLHKAMDEYHKFIIYEYKEEPVFKVGDKICFKHCETNTLKITKVSDNGYYCEDGTFLHFDNQYLWELAKQPASDNLEKAAVEAFKQIVDSDKNSFLEIFKAGANWQKEQFLAKAVDAVVTFDYYDSGDKTYGCIAHDSFCLEDFGLKDRDKVKVIVIKED